MAEDRTKSEAADKAAVTPAPAAGGMAAWLPLIVSVVVMTAVSFGLTQFVILPQIKKGIGGPAAAAAPEAKGAEAKPKSKKEQEAAKREHVVMNKLLVNVSGSMGARYLLVSLSVDGAGEKFKTAMTEHDAQLHDLACGILSAKTLADLEKPGARNLIRTELLNAFNNVLGDDAVLEIFFTEFAIQ